MVRIARLVAIAACVLAPVLAVHSQEHPVIKVDRLANVAGRVYPISLIKGRAANMGTTEASDIFIRFNTFDERAMLVESSTAHVGNLGPGEVVNFETVLAKPFAGFRLVEVKAYFKRRRAGEGGVGKGNREIAL